MQHFKAVDLEEVFVDRVQALGSLKDIGERIFDFTGNRHTVKADGLSQGHVVNMQTHEGLLDGAESVTVVVRIAQEASQTRELVIGQVDRTLHGVVRQMSHGKRRTLQSESNGQRVEVAGREDTALDTVAVHKVLGNLARFLTIFFGSIEDRSGIVIRAVDLNRDLFVQVLKSTLGFRQTVNGHTEGQRILQRAGIVGIPKIGTLQSSAHIGGRLSQSFKRALTDGLRKDRSNVTVQAFERKTVHGRRQLNDASGVTSSFDGISNSHGVVRQNSQSVLAFRNERGNTGLLQSGLAVNDLTLHFSFPFADHHGTDVRSHQNVSFADGAFGRNQRGHALVQEIAVEFGNAGLSAGLAGQQRIQTNHHGKTCQIGRHHLADSGGVRTQSVVVESTRSLNHGVRELAVSRKELLILVEANAHRKAIDLLAGSGRAQNELVAVFQQLHCLRSNRHIGFVIGNLPSIFDREIGAVKRDSGSIDCTTHDQSSRHCGYLRELCHFYSFNFDKTCDRLLMGALPNKSSR